MQSSLIVKDWCLLDQECYTRTGACSPVAHTALPPLLLLAAGKQINSIDLGLRKIFEPDKKIAYVHDE